MASGELCYFSPDNVRLFNGCEFQSTSVETCDDTYYNTSHESAETEFELSSIIDRDSVILDVNYAQMSQDGRAANERSSSSTSHELGTRASKVTSDQSWWVLLLNLNEAGLRSKARSRAAKVHLDSATLASKAWFAAHALTSHATALTVDLLKESAESHLVNESAVVREIVTPSDEVLPMDASAGADAPSNVSKANGAAVLAANAVVKARARAQFEAERFARSWLGITVGPLLGWFILDHMRVCAWRRERAKVLGIIRDAITELGSEHMSDPQVHSNALMARERAAYVLQEGGAVRLRGPNVARSCERSQCSRDSLLASSDSTLDRIVPGVPRGTTGVVVRGDGAYLEVNGFKYRHLTPDLRVFVCFPHGCWTVPADWLEETLEVPSSTPSAALGNDASAQAPIRKWKQTMKTREKLWHAAQSKKDVTSRLENGITDERIRDRLNTYNALHSRPHQKAVEV